MDATGKWAKRSVWLTLAAVIAIGCNPITLPFVLLRTEAKLPASERGVDYRRCSMVVFGGSGPIHGTRIAFLHMELDIKAPVYVGDTLSVLVEVTESRATSTGDRGLVTTRNSVRNQRDEEVLVYTPVRLLRGREVT